MLTSSNTRQQPKRRHWVKTSMSASLLKFPTRKSPRLASSRWRPVMHLPSSKQRQWWRWLSPSDVQPSMPLENRKLRRTAT
ncbi:MAG: hypothetical protein IJP75_06625 [Bacteroidaceae bacterium]|nr:hypothetical protein [Bacteroidaceae bacterium]